MSALDCSGEVGDWPGCASSSEDHLVGQFSGSSDFQARPMIDSTEPMPPNYDMSATISHSGVMTNEGPLAVAFNMTCSSLLQNLTSRALNGTIPPILDDIWPVVDEIERRGLLAAEMVERYISILGAKLIVVYTDYAPLALSYFSQLRRETSAKFLRLWYHPAIGPAVLTLHSQTLLAWRNVQDATIKGWSIASSVHLPDVHKKQFMAIVALLSELAQRHWLMLVVVFVVISLLLMLLPRLRALKLFLLGLKDARVLVLGLDNSGKSTLLLMLKDNRVAIPNRTMAPNRVRLRLDSTRLVAIDMGGSDAARSRHPWEAMYSKSVTGVIFVVDASDTNPNRLEKTRRELQALLSTAELCPTVPVLVLGNKIDLGAAMSEAQLRELLGLNPPGQHERVLVCMCSMVHKMGYGDGLRWLIDHRT